MGQGNLAWQSRSVQPASIHARTGSQTVTQGDILIPVRGEIYEKSRLSAQLIHRNALRLVGEDDGTLKEMHLKVSYSMYVIALIFCRTGIRVSG